MAEEPFSTDDDVGPSLLCASKLCVTSAECDRELVGYFENAPIALQWLDADLTVTWANSKQLELLGFPAEEYVGRNFSHFLPSQVRAPPFTPPPLPPPLSGLVEIVSSVAVDFDACVNQGRRGGASAPAHQKAD